MNAESLIINLYRDTFVVKEKTFNSSNISGSDQVNILLIDFFSKKVYALRKHLKVERLFFFSMLLYNLLNL